MNIKQHKIENSEHLKNESDIKQTQTKQKQKRQLTQTNNKE